MSGKSRDVESHVATTTTAPTAMATSTMGMARETVHSVIMPALPAQR